MEARIGEFSTTGSEAIYIRYEPYSECSLETLDSYDVHSLIEIIQYPPPGGEIPDSFTQKVESELL